MKRKGQKQYVRLAMFGRHIKPFESNPAPSFAPILKNPNTHDFPFPCFKVQIDCTWQMRF